MSEDPVATAGASYPQSGYEQVSRPADLNPKQQVLLKTILYWMKQAQDEYIAEQYLVHEFQDSLRLNHGRPRKRPGRDVLREMNKEDPKQFHAVIYDLRVDGMLKAVAKDDSPDGELLIGPMPFGLSTVSSWVECWLSRYEEVTTTSGWRGVLNQLTSPPTVVQTIVGLFLVFAGVLIGRFV